MAVMQIVIPTRGRTEKQLTLQSLPPELREQTTLVCPKREASELYRLYNDAGVKIVYQPHPNMKIAQKREWIMREWLRYGHEQVLMLDDDLSFSTRISETDWHLKPICGEELIPEFQRIEDKLGPEYPHVGFGPRQWNHLKKAGWQTPDRMMCSLGYYLPIVVKVCELGRIETHEDMDVTLQLLRKGHRNAVWHATVHDQNFMAPGGCSLWRTIESFSADARKLTELHPGYVFTVERSYKGSEPRVPRVEPICQWKKALDDGLKDKSQYR